MRGLMLDPAGSAPDFSSLPRPVRMPRQASSVTSILKPWSVFVDPGREGEEIEELETGAGAGVKLGAGTGASVEGEGGGTPLPPS
jgi:hypothetical protein